MAKSNFNRLTNLSIIFIFLIISQFSYGQTAHSLFEEANSLNERGEYAKSNEKLDKVIQLLNGTNPRVQSLKVYNHYYLGEYIQASVEFNKYMKLIPTQYQNTSSHQSLVQIHENIKEKIEEEQKQFEANIAEQEKLKMKRAEDIEQKLNEKDKKKISYSKSHSAEEKIYKKAKESGALEDLKVFTEAFPDASKFGEIDNKINAIEKENFRVANEDNAWEEAKRKNTVSGFNYYLKVYYDGKYRAQATENIYQLNASAQYQKAKSSNQLNDYVYYYENYKRGHDFQAVKNVLKNTYLNSGDDYYQNKYWGLATTQYNNYVIVNGNSYNPSYLRKRMKRAKRLYNEDSYDFTSIHYDQYGHGMSLGSLGKDHIAWYFTIKGRTHFLFGDFDTQEVTFPDESPNYFEIESSYYGDQVWKKRYTKDITDYKKQSFVGIIGLTQKIYHPLWVNVGVGFGWYNKYENVKTEYYRRSGNDYYWDEFETSYVEDPYYKNYRFTWEAGLKLVLFKKMFLSYGFTNGHGEVYQYFGIGVGGAQ